MECPKCKIHWQSFIGGSATTIDIGHCRNCGYICVADLVQLVRESESANKALNPTTKDVAD